MAQLRWKLHPTHVVLLLLFLTFSNSYAFSQQGGLRLVLQPIPDNNGFGAPTTAGYVLRPFNWNFEGGVVWGDQHRCTWGHGNSWRIKSADDLFGMGIIPHERWIYNNQNDPATVPASCGVLVPFAQRPQNVEMYLYQALKKFPIQPENITFRTFPLPPQTPAPTRGNNNGLGQSARWYEAGRLMFNFYINGTLMEGHLGAIVEFEHYTTPSLGLENGIGYSLGAEYRYAPAGHYNESFFTALSNSHKQVPEYIQVIQQHNAGINQKDNQGLFQRGQILHQANQDVLAIIHQGWQNRQRILQRSANEYIKGIWEVESYIDPNSGGVVNLDQGFDNAWALDDGSYFLSEDPFFDPARDLGINGQRLQRAQ
ncbi:MAG: hypothetical protein ABJO72_05975 [Hyphomicrobiales bacterium]